MVLGGGDCAYVDGSTGAIIGQSHINSIVYDTYTGSDGVLYNAGKASVYIKCAKHCT